MKPYRFPQNHTALILLIASLLLFSTLGLSSPNPMAKPTKTPKAGSSASEVISLVNQLRTTNGLPPYQVNAALMASAQGHSNYQASIRTITHTGAGGSDPKGRAAAAGYGGGMRENLWPVGHLA